MYAQLTYFDGPRTAEQIAAADFAGQNRIKPAVIRVPGFLANYVLRQSDGSQVVITIAESEQSLLDGQRAIMATELLPGEDPALLPGADRIEIYPVVEHVDATTMEATR